MASAPYITFSLDCLRCGYDLQSLSESAVCPECACPVQHSLEQRIARSKQTDKWRSWTGLSAVVHLASLFFYPALGCGCHFHPTAMLGLAPVVWGGFTLATYAATSERVLAYANVALAFGWIWIVWDSNLRFAFM